MSFTRSPYEAIFAQGDSTVAVQNTVNRLVKELKSGQSGENDQDTLARIEGLLNGLEGEYQKAKDTQGQVWIAQIRLELERHLPKESSVAGVVNELESI